MNNDDLQTYEACVLIDSSPLSDDETAKQLEKVKKAITAEGGHLVHEDVWGQRDLAYPIKKQTVGFYAILDFTIAPEKINELDQNLRLDKVILRHLLVKRPAQYELKSFQEDSVIPKRKELPKKEEAVAVAQEPLATDKKFKKVKSSVKKDEEVKAEVKAEAKSLPEVVETEPVPAKAEKKVKPAARKLDNVDDVDALLKDIIDNPNIKI